MSERPVPVPLTKFNPPSLTAGQVMRNPLALEMAAAGKLVLVRAPAGFGKSTAMAQARELMDGLGVATAWVTLERADNDVSRFVICLAQAAAQLGMDAGRDGDSVDVVAAFAAIETPFTLFLDDFEVVVEPAVLGLVREIIRHLPRSGQLVIGSRSLPDLGTGRLRARGQLVEIDADKLRFTLEDTASFFERRAGPALPSATLSRLHEKTEGWIAAIWLASLALERHGAPQDVVDRFSGSDRALADYLAEDVLAHQPHEVRQFLLRTSILRQLDASVCQALNPRLDCAALLEQLDAGNLFVTRVENIASDRSLTVARPPSQQGTDRPPPGRPKVAGIPSGDRSAYPRTEGLSSAWRYHSLFGDFLRAQLQREQPDEVARLHLAASAWYESHERPVPAIDHAIEGGDHPHAVGLLDKHAEQFLDQGRMRLLARWFSALPDGALSDHGLLQLISLWATCFTRGPWDAMRQLEASGCADSTVDEVRASVQTIYPLLLAMQDRYDDAYDAGRDALARLPTGLPFADSVLLNAMSNILSVTGDRDGSQRLLDAARREQKDTPFNRMYTESLDGLTDLREGRLRQATARFRIAVDSTHAVSYNHSHGNAWAGVLYADAIYEANQLAQADHLLNVYLPLARDVGLPDHMIISHVTRSRIAFQGGDVDAAFHALAELEYLGLSRQLPRVVAGGRLERARLLALQGNGPAARDELARAGDATLWARERRQRLPAHDLDYLTLAQARWDIAFGDPQVAVRSIDAELQGATATGRHRRVLKLRLLRAMASHRLGKAASAFDDTHHVLRVASQEGFVRLILDEGAGVGHLLAHHAAEMASQLALNRDPILTEHLQRLLKLVGPSAAADAPPPAGEPPEPLTRKEIRVVQLLAEGYSNSAMAEKLFVSDSTVRTHLRNINTKLEAGNRTQAVAIARRLGLIR